MKKILEVNDLHVTFTTYGGTVKAVRGVDFHLQKGETLAIVGESGCGKSVTANAIMRLIPDPPGKILAGSILFKGRDLTKLSEQQMRAISRSNLAMIFQEPITAFNPTLTIVTQLMEGLRQHHSVSRDEAKQRALALLYSVRIPTPAERLKQDPQQFS